MALSLPVVISREYTLDMRGKLFYESGGIWNWSQGENCNSFSFLRIERDTQ